jgi:transposase-like protein
MTTEKKQKLQDAIRQLRESYYDAIAAEIENSDKTYSEIAQQHGVSEQTVFQIARIRGLCRNADTAEAGGQVDESTVGGQ